MRGYVRSIRKRKIEDSSSDGDTDSCDDDEIYDNRESWGYKALTLRQIIDGPPSCMFPNNVPTLYAIS